MTLITIDQISWEWSHTLLNLTMAFWMFCHIMYFDISCINYANIHPTEDTITFASILIGDTILIDSSLSLRLIDNGIFINGDVDGNGTSDINILSTNANFDGFRVGESNITIQGLNIICNILTLQIIFIIL